MNKRVFCQLWLTCASKSEATKIAKTLLNSRLIACAKQIPLNADYWCEGKIEHAEEVLLLMESRLDLYDKVEAEVTKMHSFDTFVLEATLINRISKKATKWLEQELKNE